MFKIIFLILTLFFILEVNAIETIQAGIKYNEASARLEAFSGVDKKIDKSIFEDYFKDINRKKNFELIKNGIFETDEYYICPFYINSTLASYAIMYKDKKDYAFYYNYLGSLIKFDTIIVNESYPKKTLGYSRRGFLISVTIEVSEKEQFVYDENAKLQAHWIDNEAFDKNSDIPKFMKLKRGN